MNKHVFNRIGWILLLGFPVVWIIFGYLDWQFVFIPAAYLCFSIGNGKIKKWKWLTLSQILLLVVSFIIAFSVAFGLIQLANYLINDVFNPQGMLRTIWEWVAAILSLFLAVTPFSSTINRINDNLEKKVGNDSKCDFRE